MDRRAFLRGSAIAAAGFALTPVALKLAQSGRDAGDGGVRHRDVDGVRSGRARPVGYGPLGDPDANGIRLPRGFSSRVIATSGAALAGYVWHAAPDGGATFALADGGWIYVSNSEVSGAGGAGSVRFNAAGEIVSAQRVLGGTNRNCAGGPTPWGTWLSCEELEGGRVFECDPLGRREAIERPALGFFVHEAAAVDVERGHVYMTEDRGDGRFYRFTPTAAGDLSDGALDVARVGAGGSVSWRPVPAPNPAAGETPTRAQVSASTAFNGGEGAWYAGGHVYFTTKGDNRVWDYDCVGGTVGVLYDAATAADPILRGVDNVTAAANGDLYVAEDGGDMQLVRIEPGGEVSAFLGVTGQDGSEITGPAFSPDGTRLYLSSQRGGTGSGITYEIAGPFKELP
ncbi:MAG TPA: alkaline phosphatase PhoX [Actinomycetota bacterium]